MASTEKNPRVGRNSAGNRPQSERNESIELAAIIDTKKLSTINRLGELKASFEKHQVGAYQRKIMSLGYDAHATFIKTCKLLENYKGDIILSGITTRSHDTLAIESVSPQFLVAALVVSIQNRPLLPGTDTDGVQVYLELQEDLEALQNIVLTQIGLLDNYQKLLSPASYRVTDSSRQGIFPIESRYIEIQVGMLHDRNEDIHVQRERAKFLKEQVKQTIEILEEDHDKAIRVFTIVTAFFLPL
ncbi:hypothetical protein F5X99DRAFT_412159 [Biscogniauxia marginata]|nr:hypothetical protein F5X99DRAFT_412159 [Biscogniauxia marginata]